MSEMLDTLELFRRGRTVVSRHTGKTLGTIEGTALTARVIGRRKTPVLHVKVRRPDNTVYPYPYDSRDLAVVPNV